MQEQTLNINEKISVPKEIQKGLAEFKLWIQHKRYSESTIKTYVDGAKKVWVIIKTLS